jgi:hypothetical protein
MNLTILVLMRFWAGASPAAAPPPPPPTHGLVVIDTLAFASFVIDTLAFQGEEL